MKKFMFTCMIMLIAFSVDLRSQKKEFVIVSNGYDVSVRYKTILKKKKEMIELACSDTGVIYQLYLYNADSRKFFPVGEKEYGTGKKLLFMPQWNGIYAIIAMEKDGKVNDMNNIVQIDSEIGFRNNIIPKFPRQNIPWPSVVVVYVICILVIFLLPKGKNTKRKQIQQKTEAAENVEKGYWEVNLPIFFIDSFAIAFGIPIFPSFRDIGWLARQIRIANSQQSVADSNDFLGAMD